MNNEPVAWINVEKRKLEWANPTLWETPTVVKLDRIPLYTHPVKELDEPNWKEMYWEMHELNHKHWSELKDHTKKLTDEEIDKIVKDCIEDDYHMISNPYAVAHMVQEAILRKAQEK